MSFDARSLERLEALGRRLPQKLPLPSSPTSPAPASAGRKSDTAPRHRVEIEENPEDLFRALMEASADGSVPSHLLDRLRELEAAKPGRRSEAGAALNSNPGADSPSTGAERGGPSPLPGAPSRRTAPKRPASRPPRRASGPERDLYDAFDDLLHLEHDDLPDAPAQSGRVINELLLPKPTLRQARPGSDRA
jgi:hypothetical protein